MPRRGASGPSWGRVIAVRLLAARASAGPRRLMAGALCHHPPLDRHIFWPRCPLRGAWPTPPWPVPGRSTPATDCYTDKPAWFRGFSKSGGCACRSQPELSRSAVRRDWAVVSSHWLRLLRGGHDGCRALRAAAGRDGDAHGALGAVSLGGGRVPLEQLQRPADRHHDHEVHHRGGDQERQDLGQEGAVGEPGLADREGQVAEVALPADQGQQRADERQDELVDQAAELRTDHHGDREIDEVPAEEEILEATHARQVARLRATYSCGF